MESGINAHLCVVGLSEKGAHVYTTASSSAEAFGLSRNDCKNRPTARRQSLG